MQNDAKKKRDANNALGYKHEWIDTGGHRHRILFDAKTLEKPKTTWTTLIVVSVLAFLIGGVALWFVPATKQGSSSFFDAASSTPKFKPKETLTGLTAQTPTAIAAGWGDEFFLADRSGVGLFNVGGEKLDFWKNESSETPTALAFVSDESSAKNGLLLIAYPQRIDAMFFDVSASISKSGKGESGKNESGKSKSGKNNGENGGKNDDSVGVEKNAGRVAAKTNANGSSDEPVRAVVRTAANGALGVASTVLTIPSAEISDVASSGDRLFVADRNAERVWRYSWKTLDSLKNAETKETPPDCELGVPDAAGGYPGLRPAADSCFCAVYSPANKEVFVANSGLFRVDAFNADSGSWVSEHSWTKAPGGERSFGGAANPVALVVSPNGWVATVEAKKIDAASGGAASPLQIFDLSGSWVAEIPVLAAKEESGATYFAAALTGDSTKLLALKTNGNVDVFENR